MDSTDAGDNLSSPSPRGCHPVAAILTSAANAVAYMPSNESDVLLSDEDDDDVSTGSAQNDKVRCHPII